MRRNHTKLDLFVFILLIAYLISGCQQSSWKEFSSSNGAFSILLPKFPSEETITEDSDLGPIVLHLFTVEQNGIAYIFGYSDYPEKILQIPIDTVLDGACNGITENAHGKVINQSPIMLENKYPGRELKVESVDKKLIAQARIFMVGQRQYQLIVSSPKEKATSQNISKYLDSFKLLIKGNGSN